ncbi:hypothetical protein NADFUDRAFT_50958 [Nadsonia fulvescens var. elongata DSM 6958]|uniref:Major facilitator superfamily (MFS) profile domain-containing protein n=1 Tax=Nadsonia fulvescens var. elongata DSM 6958 TaxID=857566 RepID=A0A1E3PKG0_9ASCO|nr:hypothetical protein NADFUDRAFT_50958 [Nadsonia fulvescens var. elongata DSM 6958]
MIGYDSGLFGTLIAHSQFIGYFKNPSSSLLGGIISSYAGGSALGCMFTGYAELKDFKDLFIKPSYRRRVILAIILNVGTQLVGGNVNNYHCWGRIPTLIASRATITIVFILKTVPSAVYGSSDN